MDERLTGPYGDRSFSFNGKFDPSPAPPTDDPTTICPNCGHELIDRACKLICTRCHFYLSCSDT